MTNREALEREIYDQVRIIKNDQAGLRSQNTNMRDRILLKAQIVVRKTLTAHLMERRGKLPVSR